MRLFLVAAAIVLALVIAPAIVQGIEDRNDYTRQRQSLELDRQRWQDELDRQRAEMTQPARIISDHAYGLLVFVLVGGVMWIAFDYYSWRRTPLVKFYGQSVPRAAIERGELIDVLAEVLRMNGIAAIAEAQRPLPPHTLSYAPRYSGSDSVAALEETQRAGLPGPVDFASILDRFTPSKDRIFLALGADSEPITVPVQSLCHVALAGATGNGKSNLLRLLVPQLQHIGAQVCLADPHYAPVDHESGDDWRQIAGRLHLAPAVKPAEIDELLSWLLDELDRRLEQRNRGERIGGPLFLAYDELPVIVDSCRDAPARIGKILREGRKVKVFCLGASQDFLVKTIGGSSAVRDCYRTAFYCGGDLVSAAALLDLPRRDIDDGPLGQGIVMLRSAATAPARQVRVPIASNQAIARLLTDGQPTMETVWQANGNGTASTPIASETAKPTSPHAARILSLFCEGNDIPAIVKAIYGVSNGRQYTEASREVNAVIRSTIRIG